MNPQDPLANLHPLREPLAIGWWPPAPGWWFLIAATLLALAAIIYFLVRRHRARAYRRRALAQLALLHDEYLQSRDPVAFLARTNALLKRVALLAYPGRDIAGVSGSQWLYFLNSSCKLTAPFPPDFASAAYLKQCPDIDMEQLHNSAATWIKGHEVTR